MDLASNLAGFSSATRRSRSRRNKVLLILLFLAVLASAIAAYRYLSQPVSVTGQRVVRGPVADVIYATGFVEPEAPVEVSSRVTAPVMTVLADEGQRVTRGQALAVLDAEDQHEVIAQLIANRVNAEQDERRVLALFQRGWITNEARDKAVASANSARAMEAAGRARLGQFTIRAGISGVILRRDIEPGDLASPSKTLFEMGDPRRLRVTATVDERDIVLVRPGQSVLMSTEAFPGRPLGGIVSEITPGGNPDQRAFRVRVTPNAETLLPVGLTLEVNILASQRRNVKLVPADAVREGKVWLVDGARARRVAVQTGIHGIEKTEIISPLLDTACVIVDPPSDLKDGQRVAAKGC
jgi:RND family efflux transporter MFP subunit